MVYPSGGEDPVIGQIQCVDGWRSARLNFLIPANAHLSPALPALLDGLAQEAGLWGAFGLLAELEESSPLFEPFRRAGFSVYGWQRIFRLPFNGDADTEQPPLWRFAEPVDEIPIRQLFQNLVPPLAQAAEPLSSDRPYGLVHQENGQMLAYLESVYGPDGIYLRPLIHPNVGDINALLRSLEIHLSPLLGRKVYLAVRSHQAWLENPLLVMSSESTDRQALMVKYLAARQRVSLTSIHRSVIDDKGVEPSAPQMVKKSHISRNRVK